MNSWFTLTSFWGVFITHTHRDGSPKMKGEVNRPPTFYAWANGENNVCLYKTFGRGKFMSQRGRPLPRPSVKLIPRYENGDIWRELCHRHTRPTMQRIPDGRRAKPVAPLNWLKYRSLSCSYGCPTWYGSHQHKRYSFQSHFIRSNISLSTDNITPLSALQNQLLYLLSRGNLATIDRWHIPATNEGRRW